MSIVPLRTINLVVCYMSTLVLFFGPKPFNDIAVHDQQLVDDIPTEKLLAHDVPVDIICTPTQIIYTKTAIPKPQGK